MHLVPVQFLPSPMHPGLEIGLQEPGRPRKAQVFQLVLAQFLHGPVQPGLHRAVKLARVEVAGDVF